MSILHDVSFETYRNLPGWNWGLIKLLDSGSPLHVQHARENPRPDSAQLTKLRAIHALVLEPDHFGAQFSVFDGTRRTGTKAYDAHLEAHPGTDVLNPRELDEVRAAADAIRNHPAVRPLLETGRPEVTITWTDEETGLPCKGRADWLGTALVDLKTLGTTNEHAVARLVAKHLYHGQLAHYDAGLRANGIKVPAFLIIAEGKDSHDVAVFEVDEGIPDGALHVGREVRRRLMAKLAECVSLDHWPGRHEGVQSLCLPPYALLDDAEELTFGAEV